MMRPLYLLLGLAAWPLPGTAMAESAGTDMFLGRETRFRIAQSADAPATGTTLAPVPSDAASPAAPTSGALPFPTTPALPGTAADTARPASGKAVQAPKTKPAPALTGSVRNSATALPTMAQPNASAPSGTAASIPFGGPQPSVGPAYGSTLRDAGSGNGGAPIYSTAPTTLGGPINGTANAYTATLPNGSLPNDYVSTSPSNSSRSRPSEYNPSGFNQQPLGGRPNTRDQTGTFGGRAGYDARGVYTGTAVQSGAGYGYGSAYATTGRPTGGLLGTNVDATGPLRPYIPLDSRSGTGGRANSGYGIPNGSRATHMDGRGIQRVD